MTCDGAGPEKVVSAMFYPALQLRAVGLPEEHDLLARVTQHPDRPRPIRDIDQIFMLPGSQLAQAKIIAGHLAQRDVVFVGDGDGMAASLGLLAREGVIESPGRLLVLDFDERIIAFALQVARQFGFQDMLDAQAYNVTDPVPAESPGSAATCSTPTRRTARRTRGPAASGSSPAAWP